MKKILNYCFLFVLMFLATLGLTACEDEVSAEALMKNLIVEQQEGYVDADFFVVGALKSGETTYPITWTTNNSCLTVSSETNTAGYYTVHVTRPDNAMIEVTLTATLTISANNTATKTFAYKVYPINVYDLYDNFNFEHKGVKVQEGSTIDLPTSTSFGGKTGTITWASESSLVTIASDNASATFGSVDKEEAIELVGTLSYNGEEVTMKYNLTVTPFISTFELVKEWYENTGVTQVLSGYVVDIAANYDANYGNVSLYIINDDFTAGYYLYRVKTDAENGPKIALGVHVTVTGSTNTNYQGLMETNAGGNLVVDEDIDPIDPASTLYNIDNDLLANVPSLYYRESTLVGLNNWKVTDVATTIDDGSSSAVTIMKISKDGLEIALRYSNYLACTPMPNRNGGVESDNYKAILAKLGTIAVGDYVNVSGILSYYNKDSLQYNQSSYQILVQNADSIQKIDNGSDVTNSVGKQMWAAIHAFTGFEELYTGNATVTLPSTLGNATVTWAFHNPNHAGVTMDGSNLIIAPAKYAKVSLDATYTIGDYTTVVYYSFEVEKLSDADIANRVLESITLEETYDEGKVTLVTEADYAGATIEYIVKEGSANASIAEGKLVLVASTEDKQVVVTVKVTSGSTVVTKDLTLTVTGKPADTKVPTVVTNPVVGTAYKLGMVQENVEKTLFATGAMDGYYYATTEDYASAADIYLETATGGYYMYTSASGAKKYMNIIVNGTYINVVFEDAASSVWTYNADLNTMVTTTGGTVYYLGTKNSGTYTTFSACKVDSASFVGQFYELAAPAAKEYGVITNPVAGVAYKLQMVQENVEKTLYATGAMDGYYYATTEDLSAAADIYLEETTGGFHMYTSASGAKKYMNIIVNGTYINVVFEDAASSVWSFNSELNTLVTTTSGTVYYLGTKNSGTYTTFSACKVDSASFVGHLYGEVTGGTTTPEEPTPTPTPTPTPEAGVVTNPVVGTAYKLQMVQEKAGKTVYMLAQMNGYYIDTTTDASAGVEFYLETATGGYYLYTMVSGAKKYVNAVVSGTHVNGAFEATASSVWTYNSTINTITTMVNGTEYAIGTRNDNTYTTVGPVKVSQSPFVVQFYGEVTGGTETPDEPTPTPDPVDPNQEPAVVETTVANLVANVPTTSNDKIYVVEGAFFVADGVINAYNTYGNGRLVDPNDTTKSITVYGFAGSKDALAFADGVYTYTNPKHFPTLDINHGDKVKVGMVYDATNKRYSLYLIEVTGEMDLPKTEAAYDANALTKVTETSQLVEGAQLVVAFGTNMMGAHDGSKFARVAGTQVEVATGVETVTLVKSGDNWLLKLANGQYICYSGSSNNVSVGSATDTTAQWTIEIVDGMAVIKNVAKTERVLQYNSNSNQERFVCYKSTQNYVTLYIVK